jgi:hypothetical protein
VTRSGCAARAPRPRRIRAAVPPLDWAFDFDDGQIPITWVGARYRHKVRNVDGERVMVKVTYIPKGTRSQMWMGHADLHDYTMQADLKAAIQNNQIPDMGVIVQRYTLDMLGQSQALQIRSWPPQVRTHFSKTIPFDWKPNIWYAVKFQASTEPSGDRARVVLRGKVWPRAEREPSQWTIEAVDETPNLVGSPGRPKLRVVATLQSGTDYGAARNRLNEALDRHQQALDAAELPTTVLLRAGR